MKCTCEVRVELWGDRIGEEKGYWYTYCPWCGLELEEQKQLTQGELKGLRELLKRACL